MQRRREYLRHDASGRGDLRLGDQEDRRRRRAQGRGIPIVFASADDESGLLSWAPVDGMDIDIDGRGYALCRTPSFIG